jgi:chromosome segregation ATPase
MRIKTTMKQGILVITFLFVAGFAMGCACSSKDGKSAAAQLDVAKTETKEAAQAVKDYAYAQKKSELADIQEELDKLSARVDKSSGAAKADAKTRLDAVGKKWAEAKKQLARAESATESTWDDVKGGVKKSYGELKDSMDKTRQWLSEKIAP